MKNRFVFSIVSLFVLFFISCDRNVNYTQTKENIQDNNKVDIVERINIVNNNSVIVYRDTIDNHVYYIVTNRFDGGVTMLHSEDCMCKKSVNINEPKQTPETSDIP